MTIATKLQNILKNDNIVQHRCRLNSTVPTSSDLIHLYLVTVSKQIFALHISHVAQYSPIQNLYFPDFFIHYTRHFSWTLALDPRHLQTSSKSSFSIDQRQILHQVPQGGTDSGRTRITLESMVFEERVERFSSGFNYILLLQQNYIPSGLSSHYSHVFEKESSCQLQIANQFQNIRSVYFFQSNQGKRIQVSLINSQKLPKHEKLHFFYLQINIQKFNLNLGFLKFYLRNQQQFKY